MAVNPSASPIRTSLLAPLRITFPASGRLPAPGRNLRWETPVHQPRYLGDKIWNGRRIEIPSRSRHVQPVRIRFHPNLEEENSESLRLSNEPAFSSWNHSRSWNFFFFRKSKVVVYILLQRLSPFIVTINAIVTRWISLHRIVIITLIRCLIKWRRAMAEQAHSITIPRFTLSHATHEYRNRISFYCWET